MSQRRPGMPPGRLAGCSSRPRQHFWAPSPSGWSAHRFDSGRKRFIRVDSIGCGQPSCCGTSLGGSRPCCGPIARHPNLFYIATFGYGGLAATLLRSSPNIEPFRPAPSQRLSPLAVRCLSSTSTTTFISLTTSTPVLLGLPSPDSTCRPMATESLSRGQGSTPEATKRWCNASLSDQSDPRSTPPTGGRPRRTGHVPVRPSRPGLRRVLGKSADSGQVVAREARDRRRPNRIVVGPFACPGDDVRLAVSDRAPRQGAYPRIVSLHRRRGADFRYRSEWLAHIPAGSPTPTGRAVISEPLSLSGHVSLLRYARVAHVAQVAGWQDQIVESGSHHKSAAMVAGGEADIASIDAVTYSHLQVADPGIMRKVVQIGAGPLVPTLPLICSVDVTDSQVPSCAKASGARCTTRPTRRPWPR